MIRDICITDCKTIEDYIKIVNLCEDTNFNIENYSEYDLIIVEDEIKCNNYLFDIGRSCKFGFMYFWDNYERNMIDCTKMTVKEFYEKYDNKNTPTITQACLEDEEYYWVKDIFSGDIQCLECFYINDKVYLGNSIIVDEYTKDKYIIVKAEIPKEIK